MTEVNARTRDFFDRQVIYLIKAKYGIEDMKAIRSFFIFRNISNALRSFD